jgi:hypothetical protein
MSQKISERRATHSLPWITATGVIAHPDSPAGGGGPGRFKIASILGSPGNDSALIPHPQAPAARHRLLMDEERLVLIAQKGSLPITKWKTPKPKTIVLNLVGAFENPWKNDPTKEAKIIEDFKNEKSAIKWHPAADSWAAVFGGNITTTASLSQFLGIIKKQQPHSIERINLFSHGNRGLIAFAGYIIPQTGDVFLNTNTALDLRLAETEPIPKGGGREEESMGTIARQLQDRFTEDAQIVFYLCNSGNDPELLQVVADAFRVVVKGFSQEVWVCPEWDIVPGQPPKINRGFTSLDRCRTKQRGFAHLKPNRLANPK